MLNFEKKLEELKREKEQVENKRNEIIEMFDREIAAVNDKIAQLDSYKQEIGRMTQEQVNMLKSANDLAKDPAWVKQDQAGSVRK